MKTEEIKAMVNVLNELNGSYADLIQAMRGMIDEARATKELWRKGSNSALIKLGLALIAFPDPTISDVVGAFLVAAGTVQRGIRRRTLYIEDVHKTFQRALEEIRTVKHSL